MNSKIRKAIENLNAATVNGLPTDDKGNKLFNPLDLSGEDVSARERAGMMAWEDSEIRKVWMKEQEFPEEWAKAVQTVQQLEEGDVILVGSMQGTSTTTSEQ